MISTPGPEVPHFSLSYRQPFWFISQMDNAPEPIRLESADHVADAAAPAPTFDPVDLRARIDGWTPERQRAFVEALADSGVIREAAGQVGMSEQSVARLRRRPGSAAFVAACEAAVTIATRRMRSVAFDRAINGYTRQIFYHGELKGETRVYDPRLLILLLQKSGLLIDPLGRGARLEANWPRTVAALDDSATPTHTDDDSDKVWWEGRRLWTSFPPPPDFCGTERGTLGTATYRRSLTEVETAVIESRETRSSETEQRDAEARRDRYFDVDPDSSGG